MIEMLEYTFMQRALLAGVLISIPTALLGVYLVLKQLSLIGDGLAHASFGGIAAGLLLNVRPLLSALVFAVGASLGIDRLVREHRAEGDAAIALVYSFGMALAVTIIGYTDGFNAGLFNYLFGSLLSISGLDLVLMVSASTLVSGYVLLRCDEMVQLVFNEEVAAVHGFRTRIAGSILTLLVGLTVVVAVRAVGILLVTALLVVPPMIALQVSRSFREAMTLSVLSSMTAIVSGIMLAYRFDLPPSGVIVLLMIGLYAVATRLGD